MSCKIDYIEDRFRESNPTLADSLTGTFDAIKVKVLESKLFKPANDGTGRYLFAQESKNITAYNAQKTFVDDVNDSYKGEVIENYNGAVRINVLNLPEVQQALDTYVTPIKEGVPELFESNPELANAVYESLGFNKNLGNAKVISKTTAKEVLNSFDGGMRENFKNIINKLLEIPAFAERTINYVERPVGNAMGFYDSLNDFLGLDVLSRQETNTAQARVIVEEVMHSLTSRPFKIVKGLMSGSLSESEKKFVNDISNLRKEVLRQRPQNANDYYGLSSDEEFVARAFVDGQFQEYLSRIEVQRTNVFSKIIEYVKQLLGSYVTVKDNSALQEVLGLTEEFISKVKIAPQQKQQALQLYSQYLDTIFPDSKVKDIVYHGTNKDFSEFISGKGFWGNAFYVTTEKGYANSIAASRARQEPGTSKIIKPLLINANNIEFEEDAYAIDKFPENIDTILTNIEGGAKIIYAVSKPEQIHILGGKQDIEGFKQYVKSSSRDKYDYDTMEGQLQGESPDTINKISILFNRGLLDIEC